jgi:nucleotide-binding universal stress UspA family protein
LEEAIVGSVSRSVLRRAKVPVLLIRLPERVDE